MGSGAAQVCGDSEPRCGRVTDLVCGDVGHAEILSTDNRIEVPAARDFRARERVPVSGGSSVDREGAVSDCLIGQLGDRIDCQ